MNIIYGIQLYVLLRQIIYVGGCKIFQWTITVKRWWARPWTGLSKNFKVYFVTEESLSACDYVTKTRLDNAYPWSVSLVEKVAISIHDIEEATAKAMDIIVADKVS